MPLSGGANIGCRSLTFTGRDAATIGFMRIESVMVSANDRTLSDKCYASPLLEPKLDLRSTEAVV